MRLSFEEASDQLRRSFAVPPESLARCETILEIQIAALEALPPMETLPDSVRLAAATRLRAGEPVIPRDRVPVEPMRVVHVYRALARSLLDSRLLEDAAAAAVAVSLPAAIADDARGVRDALGRLELPIEPATALLRESLKPEMIRTSAPFRSLVAGEPRPGRCPLCGDLPRAATEQGLEACCSWCGLTWRWEPSACAACGAKELREQELHAVVRHARFLRCASCGDVVALFPTAPDPLVLSMFGVLTAPFDLALRVGAGSKPRERFPVF